jgi:hypothetical protein
MQLTHSRVAGALGLLVLCTAALTSCGFRGLTENDVVGIYEAQADWGTSTLVLRADHTFAQTVTRSDHTQASTTGTWTLTPYAGKNASHAMIAFKPFLDVSHEKRGDPAGGAALSVSRGIFWGTVIGLDPDWGISYEKS